MCYWPADRIPDCQTSDARRAPWQPKSSGQVCFFFLPPASIATLDLLMKPLQIFQPGQTRLSEYRHNPGLAEIREGYETAFSTCTALRSCIPNVCPLANHYPPRNSSQPIPISTGCFWTFCSGSLFTTRRTASRPSKHYNILGLKRHSSTMALRLFALASSWIIDVGSHAFFLVSGFCSWI